MTQPSLLDAIIPANQMRQRPGIAERDKAIDTVEANANERWMKAAYDVVRYLAETTSEFSTDEVWGCLEDADYVTHEPRAMGAVMRQAKRDGLVTPTGRYVQSTRGVNHARPVMIWRAA